MNVAVPQGSISGLLLFLIYINDLPNDLQSNPKIFADDISLFSAAQDIITNTVSLNHDLSKISEWTAQGKMNSIHDPCKQAQKLLFNQKSSSKSYPSFHFNDNLVHQVQLQKHLCLFLNSKLSFDEHIQCKRLQSVILGAV